MRQQTHERSLLCRRMALAALKRHHEDPFIQAAPLIVETIIETARRI